MRRKSLFILIGIVILSLVGGIFIYPQKNLWLNQFRQWRLGLDLVGGSHLVYEVDMSQVKGGDRDSVMNGLRDVIEKRINLFGVSEPQVYSAVEKGAYRLVVELAGIQDLGAAVQEIGSTPFLDFREVAEVQQNGTTTAVFMPTALNGRYVKSAELNFESTTNEPYVGIEFNDEGAKTFDELTLKNIGKPIAIFLDNEPISIPTVRERISGGKAQITGHFTVEEARQLVERFNAGALPAPIHLVSQANIGATLGSISLKQAIFGGLIGTLVVMIFMLLYYGFFGFFACLALLIYILLTLSVFKVVSITMTLAGIAGFILSIGMAVDANILVFERTKEEMRKGISKTSAIEEGFRRAWPSIRDSNVSTIITSLILYYYTSGFVRGFALTLLIGVIMSMFSAITVTRSLLRTFVKS